jgi:hypothetical protein
VPASDLLRRPGGLVDGGRRPGRPVALRTRLSAGVPLSEGNGCYLWAREQSGTGSATGRGCLVWSRWSVGPPRWGCRVSRLANCRGAGSGGRLQTNGGAPAVNQDEWDTFRERTGYCSGGNPDAIVGESWIQENSTGGCRPAGGGLGHSRITRCFPTTGSNFPLHRAARSRRIVPVGPYVREAACSSSASVREKGRFSPRRGGYDGNRSSADRSTARR